LYLGDLIVEKEKEYILKMLVDVKMLIKRSIEVKVDKYV